MTNPRSFNKTDLVQAGKLKVGDFVGVLGSDRFGRVHLVKPGGWFIVELWAPDSKRFTGWQPYRRGDIVGAIPPARIEMLKTRKSEYAQGRTSSLPGGIKVTEDELAQIRAKAKASGLTFSAWVRSKLLGG